jgi:hypothetical protein
MPSIADRFKIPLEIATALTQLRINFIIFDLPPNLVPHLKLGFCHFEGSPKTGPPVELVFYPQKLCSCVITWCTIDHLLDIGPPEYLLPGEILIIDTDKGFKIVLYAEVIIG